MGVGLLSLWDSWHFLVFWNRSVTSFPEDNKNLSHKLKLIKNEAPSKESAPSIPF